MARRVFACFEADPDGAVHLVVPRGSEWQAVAQGEYRPTSNDELVALVPGYDVTEHRVAIPARNQREALKAAPFAVEDDIASAIDGAHVAVSSPDASGLRQVFVCQRERMEAWCERLSSMGWSEATIVPDYALLPDTPALVTVSGRHLVQLGDRRLALDAALPPDVLQAVCDRASETPVQLSDTFLHDPADGFVHLVSLSGESASLVDMRQGAFAPRRKLQIDGLERWRLAGALAAAAFVTWLGTTLLETRALEHRADALQAESQRLYSASFPGEGRVPNPATRLREKLEQRQGSSLPFVDASAVLYAAVAEVDGARLRSIRFDRDTGRLQAIVDYTRYGDDLRLAEILNRSGVTASLGDARSNGAGISGDLTLGPAS